MTDDTHPDMAPEMARVRTFPMREFIDEGLLHHVNATAFWPLGLMLTAARWESEGERYRDVFMPRIHEALGDARAAIYAWIEHGGDNGDGKGDPLRDAAAEAIWQVFMRDMRGGAADGLILREYDPPEVVVTALPPAEAESRRAKAAAWIERRLAAIIP